MNTNKASKYFLLALLVFSFSSYSQVNIVSNPSFEEYSACPTFYGQIKNAKSWDTLKTGGGSTPDYLNTCADISTGVSVPVNMLSAGYQWPHTGRAYCNIGVIYSPGSSLNRREYIQNKLKIKLIDGKNYCITLYYSLCNRSKYAINEIGLYLDNGDLFASPNGVANVNPQIKSSGSYLTDTLNWGKMQDSYIANGSEEYISIGNFKDDSNTNYMLFNNMGSGNLSEYIIDDVSVIEINTKADAGKDTTIYKGDTAFVGLKDIGDEYTWYANGTAFYTGSEAGLNVTPTVTTTYVVKQQVCSVITYDTTVVTVIPKPNSIAESGLKSLKVYPNPVSTGILNIQGLKEPANFIFYNTLGEKVLGSKALEKVDVSNLLNGVYFMRITFTDTDESIIHKMIIQK